MLLKFYGGSINQKHLETIIDSLKRDGVIIIPTDTVYALACSIHSHKAIDRVSRIRGIKLEKANFSFLCHDLSNISEFTKPFSNEIFRLMKSSLPGPFTFILEANAKVPAIFKSNKKTIGIRVPDNEIALAIEEALGHPLMVSSLRSDDEFEEYMTDPDEIDSRYGNLVDIVVDGGPGKFLPSTVIDCTSGSPVTVRKGKGEIEE